MLAAACLTNLGARGKDHRCVELRVFPPFSPMQDRKARKRESQPESGRKQSFRRPRRKIEAGESFLVYV